MTNNTTRLLAVLSALLLMVVSGSFSVAAPIDSAFSINIDPLQWKNYTFEAELGSSETRTVELVNNTMSSIDFKLVFNPSSPSFTVSDNVFTLASHEAKKISISFTPTQQAPATANATLRITASNGFGGLQLIGNTVEARLEVPATQQFPTTKIGDQMCMNLTIKNTSHSSATIKSIDFEDYEHTASFSVSNTKDITTVAPQSEKTIQICFAPTQSKYCFSDRFEIFYTMGGGDKLASASTAVVGLIPENDRPNYPDTGKRPIDACIEVHEFPLTLFSGGEVTESVLLTNMTSNDITATALLSGPDIAFFELLNPSITIPANGTAPFNFKISTIGRSPLALNAPSYGFSSQVLLTLTGSSGCTTKEFRVMADVTNPKEVMSFEFVYPLFPPTQTVIHLDNSLQTNGEYLIRLYNNLESNIRVTKYELQSGDYFQISDWQSSPTPRLLHPKERVYVTIEGYQGGNPHTDNLLVTTENGLSIQKFGITNDPTVLATGQKSDDDQPKILLTPNPMQGQARLKLEHITNADIRIVSELGTEVYRSKCTTNEWIWNGKTNDGMNTSAGAYFILLNGTDEKGKEFSEKLMVVKK